MLFDSSVEPLSYRFEVLAKPCTSKNNTPHLPLYTADYDNASDERYLSPFVPK